MRRVLRAARLGVFFGGTSRFRLPQSVRLGSQAVLLNAPPEPHLAYDFINVLLDDEYGLEQLCGEVASVLDVGANIGLFSVWARCNFPRAVIHGYEPNPRLIELAGCNLRQVNVRLFGEGVGAESGFAVMENNVESRLGQVRFGAKAGIPITALGEAIERIGGSVDLLKLDCEGAEWDIFHDKASFNKVRLIRMEYHLVNNCSIDDLSRWAKEAGFQIDRLRPNNGFGMAWLSRAL